MRILVCLKQIIDPEIPARDFRLDPVKREAERGSANLVTNIFCENALEMALQLREHIGGTEITYGSVLMIILYAITWYVLRSTPAEWAA